MKKKLFVFILGLTTLAMVLPCQGECAQKKVWRLSTSSEGTITYTVAVGLAKIISDYVKDVRIIASAVQSPAAAYHLFEDGEFDATYGATILMAHAWNNTGVYAKKPLNYRPYTGLFLWGGTQFFMTRADRTDIKSLADFSGKKVFPWRTGGAANDTARLVLGALGLWDKIKDVQLDRSEVADALKMGTIDAFMTYTAGKAGIPSWMQDVALRVKLRVLNPSDQEKRVIEKLPGIFIRSLDPSVPYKKKPPVISDASGEMWTYGGYHGFHFAPYLDEEAVYNVAKAWFEHADEVSKIHGGLREFAKDKYEMQTIAIDTISHVPVHPGVAKYLKEKGIWKDTWTEGKKEPRP